MPAESPSRALLEPRLAALVAHLPAALDGSVDSVHKARVASRRLREVLPILTNGGGKRRSRDAVRHVRRVTRSLGPVRELDVALELLAEMRATHPELSAPIALIRRLVEDSRAQRRAEMLDTFTPEAVERTQKAVTSLADRLAARVDDRRWRETLAVRVIECGRTLRSTIEDVGMLFDPLRLHQVRIAAKKLRYVLEIAGDAHMAATARLVSRLRDAQDRLGRLHDLEVLLGFVRLADTDPGHRRHRALAGLKDVLERECLREHARYLQQRARVSLVADQAAELLRDEAHPAAAHVREASRARPVDA